MNCQIHQSFYYCQIGLRFYYCQSFMQCGICSFHSQSITSSVNYTTKYWCVHHCHKLTCLLFYWSLFLNPVICSWVLEWPLSSTGFLAIDLNIYLCVWLVDFTKSSDIFVNTDCCIRVCYNKAIFHLIRVFESLSTSVWISDDPPYITLHIFQVMFDWNKC